MWDLKNSYLPLHLPISHFTLLTSNIMNEEFLTWLEDWYKNLKPIKLGDIVKDPQKTVLISVDMVNGFCHRGPLASKNVASIIPQVINIFYACHKFGITYYLLLQDTHSEKAEEFEAYPPHCQRGSDESRTIPDIAKLPFAKEFTVIEKNCLSPAFSPSYKTWMKSHPDIDAFIIIGNCTDLCVYTVAMQLRLEANAKDVKRRVIVVADSVATYDLPVETAQKIDALAHDAALLHKLFLYHMKLNGIEVVSSRS